MKFPIPAPKAGQRRTIKRFAFLPEEMTNDKGDRFTVWLEFYFVIQEFIQEQTYIKEEWREIEKKVR